MKNEPIPDTIEFDNDGRPKISPEAQKRIDDYISNLQEKLGPLQPNIPHQVPMWIVFPDHIVNTNNISYITRSRGLDKDVIEVELLERHNRVSNTLTIPVPDINKTWNGLCEIFTGHDNNLDKYLHDND